MRSNTIKKISILILIVISLVVGSVVTAGCGTKEEAANKVKIGLVIPLTGGFPPGFSHRWGYELHFDKYNQGGGVDIGGKKYTFEYFCEDDRFTPEGAGIAAKKLVEQDKVKFVFGSILDLAAAAIYPVTRPAGALYSEHINMAGTAPDVSKDKDLLVRTYISFDSVWVPDIEFLLKNYPNVKTVAMVVPDQGYEPMVERFTPIIEGYGIKMLDVEITPIGTEDFIPAYTKVLASKPDVLIAFHSATGGLELRAARSLGFKGPFISTSPFAAETMLRTAGAEFATDAFCNGADATHPTKLMQECMDAWAAKHSDQPFVSDAFMTWDGAGVLVQAMQKAQSVDPRKVFEAFQTMTNPGDVQTVFGPGRIGGMSRFGVNRVLVRPVPMSRFMNGQLNPEAYILPEVGKE